MQHTAVSPSLGTKHGDHITQILAKFPNSIQSAADCFKALPHGPGVMLPPPSDHDTSKEHRAAMGLSEAAPVFKR